MGVTTTAKRLAARSRWRARLHEIIFEADTAAGRAYNPIARFDSQLFVAVMSGEHAVHGVGPGVAEMAAAPSRALP